jgi:sugar fermentation stimulation protein A
MPSKGLEKGSYILVIRLRSQHKMFVGSLGEIRFKAGWYIYAGSAMGGFGKRLSCYGKKIEKPHWHIDYLLQIATLRKILVYAASECLECQIAGALMKAFESVPGFGCTDCRCMSHMFYATCQRELNQGMAQAELMGGKRWQ